MAVTNEQKSYYKDKICSLCKFRETCNKDKFVITEIYDRVSMRCITYTHEDTEE